MRSELKINKELGTLAATIAEWYRVQAILNSKFQDGPFHELLNRMVDELVASYTVVVTQLKPILAINDNERFQKDYELIDASYKESYLSAASQPRQHLDGAYETYLELQQLPEFKTSYPLIKDAIAALDIFIDKWVTNDSWIVLSTDAVFKSLARLLLEISNLKKQDMDEAWLRFNLAFTSFSGPLLLIEQRVQRFSCRHVAP